MFDLAIASLINGAGIVAIVCFSFWAANRLHQASIDYRLRNRPQAIRKFKKSNG